jgi:trk system potassium uptake protein TrkH
MNRVHTYLIKRYEFMLGYLGLLMLVIGGVMLFPIVVLPFVPSELSLGIPFVLIAAGLAGCGLLIRHGFGLKKLEPLDFTESSIVVFLTWFVISIGGAIPYMMISGMSFTHAIFDSVSGWTTTGLSLLNIPAAPKIMLFYRAWTQFIGGAGFAIIMLASLTGVGAQHIYSAEGKGTLIKPNVLASARIVVSLYLGYFFLGSIAYLICGMNVLDTVVHCFGAISTGGFSNYPQNMGYFNAPIIEFITEILMIMGNLSFLTGYFIVKGKFGSIIRNGEVKVMTISLLLAIPIVFLGVTSRIYTSASYAIRVSVFETVSALTTTGFSLVNYNQHGWYDNGIFVLIVLMLIGGGTCSTAGGIKQMRIYMMCKAIIWRLRKSLLPDNAIKMDYIWEGDLKVYTNSEKHFDVASFVFLYFGLYFLGTMVISLSINPATGIAYSLRDAMFEFASAIGTVGMSIGVSTTNAPLHVIWTESIGMLLGRLEFFVVFIAIIKMLKDGALLVGKR